MNLIKNEWQYILLTIITISLSIFHPSIPTAALIIISITLLLWSISEKMAPKPKRKSPSFFYVEKGIDIFFWKFFILTILFSVLYYYFQITYFKYLIILSIPLTFNTFGILLIFVKSISNYITNKILTKNLDELQKSSLFNFFDTHLPLLDSYLEAKNILKQNRLIWLKVPEYLNDISLPSLNLFFFF